MKQFKCNIYTNWYAIAEDDGTPNEIKLIKKKQKRIGSEEKYIYLPRQFLIDLGKWLDAQLSVKEIEEKLRIKKT